jgi:hypothetical protein
MKNDSVIMWNNSFQTGKILHQTKKNGKLGRILRDFMLGIVCGIIDAMEVEKCSPKDLGKSKRSFYAFGPGASASQKKIWG